MKKDCLTRYQKKIVYWDKKQNKFVLLHFIWIETKKLVRKKKDFALPEEKTYPPSFGRGNKP